LPYAPTSAEEQKVIEIVWKHFEREQKWPTRKSVKRACAEAGFEFDPEALRGCIYFYHGVSSQEVRLSFEPALTIPRVRELLRPVPELLQLGARRFIENPKFDEDPQPPCINHEDFARYWPDPTEMALARALFDMGDWRLGGHITSGPAGFSYSCSVEAIRYEKVQTLDEALSVRERRSGLPGEQTLSGAHLRLLEAVYRHVMAHGEWPVAIPFALAHRHIGFIPDLAEDLRDSYLEGGFGRWKSSRITLKIWSLPLVDPTGETRDSFVKAVRALAQLWDENDDDRVRITLAELSQAMEEPERETLIAARFIQSEHLWRGGDFDRSPSKWAISIDQNVDISRYNKIRSWDDYLAVRQRAHGEPRHLAFQEVRVAASMLGVRADGAEQLPDVAQIGRVAEDKTQGSGLAHPGATSVRDSVFISYSRKDKAWFEQLKTQLVPLVQSEAIKVWDDTRIAAGADWKKGIEDALARCKVAVLLVSAHFLASEFIVRHELPPLLDAARSEGVTILWVPISACLVEKSEIWKYQAVLNPSKPLKSLRAAQRDSELVKVCQEIEKALK
jgi:hypothetical protein